MWCSQYIVVIGRGLRGVCPGLFFIAYLHKNPDSEKCQKNGLHICPVTAYLW